MQEKHPGGSRRHSFVTNHLLIPGMVESLVNGKQPATVPLMRGRASAGARALDLGAEVEWKGQREDPSGADNPQKTLGLTLSPTLEYSGANMAHCSFYLLGSSNPLSQSP
ncbi:hypothetical protein AAY473_020925, partial [Plecturocebus cupreus]